MSITIKKRISYTGERSIESAVNVITEEIQSIFNQIGITRFSIGSPQSDYFLFDKTEKKLYLHTIEGEKYEIAITEI